MSIKIIAAMLGIAIGVTAQTARAEVDFYMDAVAYALSASGQVYKNVRCGGALVTNSTGPCDEAWHVVDTGGPTNKFIQASGNYLFEVETNGKVWINNNRGNPANWIMTGVDTGVTSPDQISAGRNEFPARSGLEQMIPYKVSNKKLFQWTGSAWAEITKFSAIGTPAAVSGDVVALNTNTTGLRTLFHISNGARILDRQYGPFVGTVDETRGSSSAAYFARFIVGTVANQETVVSTYLNNPQYGPAFTFNEIKGFAVASTSVGGPSSVFMLLPRSPAFGDNNVLMIDEGATPAPFVGDTIGQVIRPGLSAAIAAGTVWLANTPGNPRSSVVWVLKPNGDVFQFTCKPTTCTTASKSFANDHITQIVATTSVVPSVF